MVLVRFLLLISLTSSTFAFAEDFRDFAFLAYKNRLTERSHLLHQKILADGTFTLRELQNAFGESAAAYWAEGVRRKLYGIAPTENINGESFFSKYYYTTQEISEVYKNPNPDQLKHVIELYSDILLKKGAIQSNVIMALSLMLSFSNEWFTAHRPVVISIPTETSYQHHIAFMKAGETAEQFQRRIHYGGLSVLDISKLNGHTTVKWRPASQLNLKTYALVDGKKLLLSQVYKHNLRTVDDIARLNRLIQLDASLNPVLPISSRNPCEKLLQAPGTTNQNQFFVEQDAHPSLLQSFN